MTAPIRHSIELNAVGELHFVLLVKFLKLLRLLSLTPKLSCALLLLMLVVVIVGEFVLLETVEGLTVS